MRYWVLAFLLALAMPAVPAKADIREGDFEVQGWCITGPDPRMASGDHAFHYAVTGKHNPSATVNGNDRDHIHLDDLIADGNIPNAEATYGHAYIFSGYWAKGEDGQNHFRVYVTKDDFGLEEVSCETALQVTPNTKDQYLPEGTDTEMQREHGFGSDGQTTTEHNKQPRGAE